MSLETNIHGYCIYGLKKPEPEHRFGLFHICAKTDVFDELRDFGEVRSGIDYVDFAIAVSLSNASTTQAIIEDPKTLPNHNCTLHAGEGVDLGVFTNTVTVCIGESI